MRRQLLLTAFAAVASTLVVLPSIAQTQSKQNRAAQDSTGQSLGNDAASAIKLDFRSVGPSRGGRVTAVAGVNQHRNRFYMGATGGGVWRTDNYGSSWHSVSDGAFETGSIGAIDVADSDPNVVYVGTGSTGLRSNVITGRGVYGSTDAGETWSFLGLRDAGQIGDVVIDPRDPNTVFVAALGNGFKPNTTRGVYRSRDGGATWTAVLQVSDQVGFNDLSLDPTNPRRIFAAAWKAQRKPWTIQSGSADPEEHGLYRSTDGGDNWQRVKLPTGDVAVGKIAVEISPADPRRVYALVEAEGTARGLYRSDNGGKTFAFVNDQISLTHRPFYYMRMTADPENPELIYVHNETEWVSTDAGETFEALPTPHGDNHAMWIHPDDPTLMVQGNDGGANVSLDRGKTWSPQWNQVTAELYQVTVDNNVPYRLYGAQQDNTTISVSSNLRRSSLDPKQDWLELSGCETGPVVPDPRDANIVFGGCKGRHSVFDKRTGQTREYWVYPHFNYGHDTREMPFRFQRVAPMILSPHNPDVIYHGSQMLHKSSNEGRTWETISGDLTAFDDETQGYSGGPITRDITGEEVYSAIYEITESPHEEGVLWVGSNDGPINISRDGGTSWAEITPHELPKGGRVNKIDHSPHRIDRAWITVYRHLLGDFKPYVFRADNYGARMTLVTDGSNGIPSDTPVRVVREDPEREGLLYAGTEFGLYFSLDGGTQWHRYQRDLPVTPITDIRIHRGDLILSTMGRSFWIVDDLAPLRQWSEQVQRSQAHLFAPGDAYRVRLGRSRRGPAHGPQLESTGVNLDYWLNSELAKSSTLELRVLDSEGTMLRSFSQAPAPAANGEPDGMRARSRFAGEPSLGTTRGHHRIRWDLREESIQVRGRPLRGPMVTAGEYRIELTHSTSTSDSPAVSSQPLHLLADPNVAAAGITEVDLGTQRKALRQLRSDLVTLQQTLNSVVDLREQILSVLSRTDVTLSDATRDLGTETVAEFSRIEELLVQPKAGKVGAELEPQLLSQYTYLLGLLDSADQAPGDDALRRLDDVGNELKAAVTAYQAVKDGQLAELGRRFNQEKVPLLAVKSSAR